MSTVVTELVIDSDAATRGAQQYARAMDDAEGSTKGMTSSLQGMAVALAAGVAGTVAMMAGLRGYIDMVGKINKQFLDLDDSATRAGLSLKEVQQRLFAARSSGISEKDFFGGLDKIGTLLTDAGRGVTEFGKLFEKNGVSIRNSNGELKTQKQVMADLAGLVQNASPQVAEGVRKITGLSKEWIEHLKQGAPEIDRIGRTAEQAGDLVTKATIDKAREFDREWNKATAAWELQLRASIATIMPLLQNLATMAIMILNVTGRVAGFFMDAATPLENLGDNALKQKLADTEALRLRMIDLAKAQDIVTESYKKELEGVSSIERGLQEVFNAKKEFQLRTQKSLLFGDDQADLKAADAQIAKIKELMKAREDAAKGTKLTVTFGGTQLPAGKQATAEAADAVDRMLLSLNRHTLQQEADAKAIGLGARALAEYRAEAQFTAAVTANGGKVTEAQTAEFERLRIAAGNAAEALEKARREYERTGALANAAAGGLNTFIDGLISGRGAAESFNSALSGIGQSLQSIGTQSLSTGLRGLFSGRGMSGFDPVSLGIGAAGIGLSAITSLFTQSSQRREEERRRAEEEQRQVDAGRARQVQFRGQTQMVGVDQSTLQGALTQWELDATQQRGAELAAGNQALAALEEKLAAERLEIFKNFTREAEDVLKSDDPLSAITQRIEDLANAAARLGAASDQTADSINQRVLTAMAKLRRDFTSGIEAAINDATGFGYRNQIADLIKDTQGKRADAVALGVDPALIDRYFQVQAQKIVEDAGLVGDAFTELTAIFPSLNGVVTQSSEVFQKLDTDIEAFINRMKLGSDSILSPTEQFAEAQRQYQQQLGLAQGGDRDALAGITAVSQTFADVARNFLGPSMQFGDIINTMFAQLEDLRTRFPATGMLAGGVVAGYAAGGMVGNGMWNRDSVLASYAGGGHVGLAGGEFVMPAPQTANNLSALQSMRSGGASNDNENLVAELRALRADNRALMGAVARLLAEGNGRTAEMKTEIGALRTDTRQNAAEGKIRKTA